MPLHTRRRQASPLILVTAAVALAVTCSNPSENVPASGDTLQKGTWGGENAGLIVGDTVAHVHVNCTLGNFPAPVVFQTGGRFQVAGTYVLRAFPVHIGPDLPAQFAGQVAGNRLTLTVTVNDTVAKQTVTVGPVVVALGREPRMGPCPICAKPEVDREDVKR